MDDVVDAVVGGAWVIAGAIIIVGGIVSLAGLFVSNATLRVEPSLWVLLSLVPALGGRWLWGMEKGRFGVSMSAG